MAKKLVENAKVENMETAASTKKADSKTTTNKKSEKAPKLVAYPEDVIEVADGNKFYNMASETCMALADDPEDKVAKNNRASLIYEIDNFRVHRPLAEADFEVAIDIAVDNDMSDNIRWAKIAKLAESRLDQTSLPLELCNESELRRRLRNVLSLASKAKSSDNMDKYMEHMTTAELIKKHIPETVRRSSGKKIMTDADPSKLSQEDLRKLIRNYQSRKCSAKKAGDEKAVAEWQAKVDEASKYRTGNESARKTSELESGIKNMIATLKQLPESEEVKEQITKLEKMLG